MEKAPKVLGAFLFLYSSPSIMHDEDKLPGHADVVRKIEDTMG
jgi:hypothetical protein